MLLCFTQAFDFIARSHFRDGQPRRIGQTKFLRTTGERADLPHPRPSVIANRIGVKTRTVERRTKELQKTLVREICG